MKKEAKELKIVKMKWQTHDTCRVRLDVSTIMDGKRKRAKEDVTLLQGPITKLRVKKFKVSL